MKTLTSACSGYGTSAECPLLGALGQADESW